MTNDIVAYRRILVQTADDIGPSVVWTTHENVSAPSAASRWALEIGEGKLSQVFGFQKPPTGSVRETVAMVDGLPGRYVRLLQRDDAGSVAIALEDEDPTTWQPFWWGIVIESERETDNAADPAGVTGTASWRVAGILWDLDVDPKRGHETGYAVGDPDSIAVDPGELLGFNLLPGGDRRLVDEGTLGLYRHERGADARTLWTAADAVRYLLYNRNLDGGVQWAIAGQEDALTYSEEWRLQGLSYLTRIGRILSPRRGVGFRAVVSEAAGIVYLHVTTTVATDITVGDYTLPASIEQVDVDIRGEHFIALDPIREDHSAVLDEIGFGGHRPWRARTFAYPDDLEDGWTPEEEEEWLSSPIEVRSSERLSHVFRRFVLQSAPPSAVWVNNGRVQVTSADYGTAGEDGTQNTGGNGTAILPLELTRKLPLYAGYDYTAAMPTEVDKTRPLQDPKLFFKQGLTYLDYSDMFQVGVDDDSAAVILGASADDALRIRQLIGTYGGSFYVTVGVLEPLPLRVLWRRAPADWPRSLPRRRIFPMPSAELGQLAAGTLLADGVAVAVGGIVRDDRDSMREALALARAWYGSASFEVSWTAHEVNDVSSPLQPGALLRNLTIGDRTIVVNAVITAREWSFGEDTCSTRYSTKRTLPDLHAVLSL